MHNDDDAIVGHVDARGTVEGVEPFDSAAHDKGLP
jgi:hypothetical protein